MITPELFSPSNNDSVTITGDTAVAKGKYAINFVNSWSTSKDKERWEKLLLETVTGLKIAIVDTMYIRRYVTNGCDTLSSNILTFIGQKLSDVDYVTELGLNIITTVTDDSTEVNLKIANQAIKTGYISGGDGNVPTLSYGYTIFPYYAETFKDSLLSITQ